MTFREIIFGSEAYQRECVLRQEVLRAPLGLKLDPAALALEDRDWHFGLFDEHEQLVACAIAVPLSERSVKIRQMAVHSQHQSCGLGRQLLTQIEQHLGVRGITHASLHARVTAQGFYERLGYQTSGDVFTEVGLPHVRMEKTIVILPAT
jgi:predicted GNAT family N-acyltransferase